MILVVGCDCEYADDYDDGGDDDVINGDVF